MGEVFLVINDSQGTAAKFVLCTTCAALIPDPTSDWTSYSTHEQWHEEAPDA